MLLLSTSFKLYESKDACYRGSSSNITGFQAIKIAFPSAGCWQVTGKASDNARMTFVTLVRLLISMIKPHGDGNSSVMLPNNGSFFIFLSSMPTSADNTKRHC